MGYTCKKLAADGKGELPGYILGLMGVGVVVVSTYKCRFSRGVGAFVEILQANKEVFEES